MKPKVTTLILLVGAIGVAGLSSYRAYKASEEADKWKKEHETFCRSVKTSLSADLLALKDNDKPERSKLAMMRISSDHIYHGDSSAKLCLKDKMPDSEEWVSCVTFNDVACLRARTEKLIRLIENE